MKKICPDCRQPLDRPQRPCGYVESEPTRIEFPGSNLVQLFATAPTPVWCATCERAGRAQLAPHGGPRPGAGRPVTGRARVSKSLRILQEPARRIDAHAKRTGQSQGDVVSALGMTLPPA